MSTKPLTAQQKIIRFKNVPVVMTEQLAELYGSNAVRIRQNYHENKHRFVDGKHYFKLEGQDLREFKVALSSSKLLSKNARSIILWTERGAARHAKMLDTDHAWEVFERLEDCYFNQSEKALPKSTTLVPNQNAMYLPKAEGKYFIENKKDGTLIVRDANKVTAIRRRDLDVVIRDCQTIRQELELFLRQIEKMEKSLELSDELLPILGQLNWRGI